MTNDVLKGVGIQPIPWDRFQNDGFDALFAGTAPTFWIFFLLTGLSLFVLRAKDSVEMLRLGDPKLQPFRLTLPWFPLLPLIFCASCVFGIYSALDYAGWICLIGFVPLAVGVPLYLISALQGQRQTGP
jgi:amino acid transporter